MKLLLTTSTYPTREGDGVPRFIADLANVLAAHADVEVLAPDAPGADRNVVGDGATVRRFTYWIPRSRQRVAPGVIDNLSRSWLARIQLPFFLAAQIAATFRRLRQLRPDVINAHWLVPQGLIAALLRFTDRRRTLVVHAHAGDVDLLSRIPLGARLARFILRASDVVFVSSANVRDRLDQLVGAPTNATVRSMGVDLDVFAASKPPETTSGHAYLLFVGRLAPKKGVAYLIEAFAQVRDVHPELELVIIGTGPELDELRNEAARVGVDRAVNFAGPQSHQVVAQHMSGCAALVVPSIVDDRGETEGLPTVILEGLAAGAPVVATAVAGAPEVIRPSETGWLAEPRSAEDLTRAITAALTDGQRDAIVESGRRLASHYSWDVVASDYIGAMAGVTAR